MYDKIKSDDQARIDSVVQEMFAVLRGHEVLTRWSYRTDDPYAVTMAIGGPAANGVVWLMARDLLVEGMLAPVGIGDVRVSPFLGDDGDLVEVEIGGNDGFASLEFDYRLLQYFLSATFDLVELGKEAEMIDFEAEIKKITDGCLG
jgi:hypothetical protein